MKTILRPYVPPLLVAVDLRSKTALAEAEAAKLGLFVQVAPPTSVSNVQGGSVFGPPPGRPPGAPPGRLR